MKRITRNIIIYTLIAGVVVVLIGYRAGWFAKESVAAKGDYGSEERELPVTVYIARPGELTDRIVATGTVLPAEEVTLSAEVAGRITAINFTEGATVSKGAVLVTINDAELNAQLEKVNYSIKLAEEREVRAKSLIQKEAISQEEYDRVLTELNTIKSEASLIKAQIQKTRITAPFSGTIGLRQVSEGAFVTPGQRIANLTQMQPVKIEFSVPERFSGSVTKNSKIAFSLEGNNKKYEATVYAVEPSIDQSTRSVTVRALYQNNKLELRPGSFARIEFELNHLESAIKVPAQAVIPELGSYRVFVYKSGIAIPADVGVGIRTTEYVQITSGINPGDTVIATGILQLRGDMPVSISNYMN